MSIAERPPPPAPASPHAITQIHYPTSDGKPMAETDKHRDVAIYFIKALKIRYASKPDVYVSGNNFIYYGEGEPKKCISPDCYVVFGVSNRLRDSYKVWEEGGNKPEVVFEFTSKSTRAEDNDIKYPRYESVLQVPEYFRFDPTGDYLSPRLQGFRLENGQYEPLEWANGRLYSQVLELELVVDGWWLRLYDREREEWLLTPEEEADARKAAQLEAGIERRRAEMESRRAETESRRAETESRRAQMAERRVENEAQRAVAAEVKAETETRRAGEEAAARQEAEAEIIRLRAQLTALTPGNQ